MTSTSSPIVFFGTETFSLASLTALVEAGFAIGLVVTKPDSKQGRGHRLTEPIVKTYAAAHNIPVLQPRTTQDIIDAITPLTQPTGVLVSYGKIIPQAVIDVFPYGIVNVHPSLLPRYRGPSPIESAIVHGDTETGISLMQLSARMDAGPIYKQTRYALNGAETAYELSEYMAQHGARELVQTLPAILDGSLRPTPQDDKRATYCSLLAKSDGMIDWHMPAVDIERRVRAYIEWPKSRTTIAGLDCVITKASVVNITSETPGSVVADKHTLRISTGDGWLMIHRLKPAGKKEMPIQAFLAGYQSLR
ncbi:MAG: methionyl-tRNA formyltransferase [Candidatus Saccharimonadales bacterium]